MNSKVLFHSMLGIPVYVGFESKIQAELSLNL